MTGRNAPRSKQGCTTCRRRKVKCDEKRPVCQRCRLLDFDCEWAVSVPSNLRRHRPDTARQLQPVRPRVNSPQDLEATFTWLTPAPFYHHLSDPNVPCANALTLSATDRKYLHYFPSSTVVFYYMKKWQWSSFNYLYQEPAATHKVIMRMIVAISASDMHHSGLGPAASPAGRPTAEDHARFHYANAVREFRELLETPGRDFTQEDLEMMFVTMFLMITYEWQFGRNVSHLQTHLQGVRSLLETQPSFPCMKDVDDLLSGGGGHRTSLIPEQLLLWILYVDVNCRPMGLSESLFDYVLKTKRTALHPDRLHRCARLWARCYWGREYPDDEVTDDMENYRALQLLHEGMKLRHKLWEAFMGHPQAVGSSPDAESLFAETLAVQERFSDLFITAKLASKASTRRTLNTINMAVTTIYAQVLFHRRLLLSPSGPPATPLHVQSLRNIVEICRKQHDSDPRLLRRLHWPLLAAVIEVEDDAQREWLRKRLAELKSFHAECAWVHEVAERVLQLQGCGQGQYISLGAFLRDYKNQ